MASGLRTVSIKFNGDAKGLEQAADKAEKGLRTVGDRAENLDDKSSKATDSLGALSSGFELVGLDKYAGGLQSVALATDFMSGVGTGLNLVMNLSAVQFIRAKVAALAYAVQQKAVAVATKTWTGIQWLLNAAMTANPIGLVVLAIVALIAIIVLAWKRSDTFRAIVTGAFSAVLAAAGAVGRFFTGTLWPGIKWAWDKITGGATAAKNGIVSGFNAVVGFITGLPKRITSAASGMFGGITGAFKSAINWVIGKWNGLSFTIPGVDTHIPGVGTVGGFTLNTPNIPMLARGGTALGAGLALVGENGPELLAMNRGASVIPLDHDAGPTVLEAHIEIGGEVVRVVQVELRKRDRKLRRTVRAGAAA
jgi:phage-related protein